jgi:hypothetical protein
LIKKLNQVRSRSAFYGWGFTENLGLFEVPGRATLSTPIDDFEGAVTPLLPFA